MTKRPFLLLFLPATLLHAGTFQETTDAFPIGMDKGVILQSESKAKSVPALVAPLVSFTTNESIVWLERTAASGLVVQFYVVDDKVRAIFLSRVPMPGAKDDREEELTYVRPRESLGQFPVLRVDREGNPVEVVVEKKRFDASGIVALLANCPTGPELWIVDEKFFDPKAFFLAATKDNLGKILANKRAADQRKKEFENLKKKK
jgi:hypothetical protein